MIRLGDLKRQALQMFAVEPLQALRLYDAALTAQPLDFESRLRAGDCLHRLGYPALSADVYRSVAWYCLKSGHPLTAFVAMRVLETQSVTVDDLYSAFALHYAAGADSLATRPSVVPGAARLSAPSSDCPIRPPDPGAVPDEFISQAATRATTCLDNFDEYPEVLHPIPLLSSLSESAFRRVLETLVVRRLPDAHYILRQGEPGESFFFVALGAVRVFVSDALGHTTDLAVLGENAIFGEMALLSARPRSASVVVQGEADLLEVTRQSLSAVAGELAPVAQALHSFTRERLLRNLMATSSLFRPFDTIQQRELLRRFTSHDVAPDTPIINEGDPGHGLFVVLSGEVEVTKSDGASQVLLDTLRAGDVFGEMSLLAGSMTTATVRAMSPVTVLFLAREYVARIVSGFPEIAAYLHALAEDRQAETTFALAPRKEPDQASILI